MVPGFVLPNSDVVGAVDFAPPKSPPPPAGWDEAIPNSEPVAGCELAVVLAPKSDPAAGCVVVVLVPKSPPGLPVAALAAAPPNNVPACEGALEVALPNKLVVGAAELVPAPKRVPADALDAGVLENKVPAGFEVLAEPNKEPAAVGCVEGVELLYPLRQYNSQQPCRVHSFTYKRFPLAAPVLMLRPAPFPKSVDIAAACSHVESNAVT